MPYKDPIKRKEFKHQYYLQHKAETISRVTEYHRTHRDAKRKIDRKYNQQKNAPYHEVLDNAGIERKCVVCGSVENMHTHHIDGNHNNNDLSNLQWLCSSCHSKLHAQLRRERDTKEVMVCVS